MRRANNAMNKSTIQKSITLAGALFLELNLSACGGDGSSGNGSNGNEAPTAPTVSNTSPLDNASNVTQNSIITAAFNEDILNTSVNALIRTLAVTGANNTSGSVNFDGTNNIVSFTPDNPLAKLTTYTATLSTTITDLSGNALANNYSWSFTTTDKVWGNAEEIENNIPNADLSYPQIVIDNNGNAVVVWHQRNRIPFSDPHNLQLLFQQTLHSKKNIMRG